MFNFSSIYYFREGTGEEVFSKFTIYTDTKKRKTAFYTDYSVLMNYIKILFEKGAFLSCLFFAVSSLKTPITSKEKGLHTVALHEIRSCHSAYQIFRREFRIVTDDLHLPAKSDV